MEVRLLTELGTLLVRGPLTDPNLLRRTREPTTVWILPEANVIKVGSQCFIDRGRAAVFPLIEEIVENLGQHKMIIGTGAFLVSEVFATRSMVYMKDEKGL